MANRIRRLREERGLTQQRLAELLAVDQTQVSRWESKGQNLSATTALALARELGVSVEELGLEDDEPEPKANRIAEQRRRRGLDLTELARRVGLSDSTLALIEAGRLQCFAGTALVLARELGISVEELGLEPDRARAS